MYLHLLKAHCTHLNQPLDLYAFNAAKTRSENLACVWAANHAAKTLTKYSKIKEVLYPALEATLANKHHVRNSFRQAGLYPFDSRNVHWDKTKAADKLYAKDDADIDVPEYIVFPPLSPDVVPVLDDNIVLEDNVDVVQGVPASDACIIDEFADIPLLDDIENGTGENSHSIPGFAGFSEASMESFPLSATFPLTSSSASASASATSASASPSSSGSVTASASSSGSSSYSLKTVGNNVRIENRERHLSHFEQSVLTIEQVEKFNDIFGRGITDVDEPLFQAWLLLKRAAAPPPTEEEAFARVIRNAVPRNIERPVSKRKAIGPSGPEKVDPTSDGWVEYLEEVEERRKLPRLEPPS